MYNVLQHSALEGVDSAALQYGTDPPAAGEMVYHTVEPPVEGNVEGVVDRTIAEK